MPAAAKKSRAPAVPRARRVADAKGRMRLVPFNPSRANELLFQQGFESVAESIGFWVKRLTHLACPRCGVIGTLQIEYMSSGLLIECDRYKAHACNFQWESHFHGKGAR